MEGEEATARARLLWQVNQGLLAQDRVASMIEQAIAERRFGDALVLRGPLRQIQLGVLDIRQRADQLLTGELLDQTAYVGDNLYQLLEQLLDRIEQLLEQGDQQGLGDLARRYGGA